MDRQNIKYNDQFQYTYVGIAPNVFTVQDWNSSEFLGKIQLGSPICINDDINSIIQSEFPTYCKYNTAGWLFTSQDQLSNITVENNEYNKFIYNTLFQGCMTAKYKKNESEALDVVDKIFNWLESTDFYFAPASTRFHESCPGGLLFHTLKVVQRIFDLIQTQSFKSAKLEEAVLCALVHDWCKINTYKPYNKNVKDEEGRWTQVMAYSKEASQVPFGHGEASLYIASKFLKLSLEESLAIRWHMGKWYTHDALDNELSTAGKKFPLVHLLQFADELALAEF